MNSPPFFLREAKREREILKRNASARENHPTREKATRIFLPPRRVSPFLAWGDFHARSRFARSTFPEEKWVTTRSLGHYGKTVFLLS